MEYERAIYRVYERCMEGLREETEPGTMKYCRIMELVVLGFAVFFLIALISLHMTFVGGSPDLCLRQLLLDQNVTVLAPDQILYINIDSKFAPEPGFLRSNEDDYTSSASQVDAYFGQNKYFQSLIDLIPKTPASRVLSKVRSNPLRHRHRSAVSSSASSLFNWGSSWFDSQQVNGTSGNTTVVTSTVPVNETVYPYEFSFETAILAMPMEMRRTHGFPSVNVTMSGSQCFGSSFVQSLLPLGGIDGVVLNNVVQFVRKPGSLATFVGDFYAWEERSIVPYDDISSWIAFKVSVATQSVFCFFLLSTTTALLIRILISSGVVLLFPVFALMQLLGVNVVTNHIIRLSYPWIGIPLEYLRIRNRPAFPFIMAHTTRVILSYVYYESCQIAFSFWLYDEISPGQVQLWLFASMMIWEYYAMIYVRSMMSIKLFPRASFALFLLYHFYIYCHPFGFHLLALIVMQLFLTVLMIHCVRKYEVDAFYRGLVSLDHPRMAYNTTPWPTWMGALAPDLTVFMPLSDRTLDVYQQQIPVPGAGAGMVAQPDIPLVAATTAGARSSSSTDAAIATVNAAVAGAASSSSSSSSVGSSSSQYQSLGQTVIAQHGHREVELSTNNNGSNGNGSNESYSAISRLLRGEPSRIRIGSNTTSSTTSSSVLQSTSASQHPSSGSATYSLLHRDSSRRSTNNRSGVVVADDDDADDDDNGV